MEALSVRPLNAYLSEKAKKNLNENPKKISDDLEALRSWLSKQPHIIARTEDQFLIAFLRGCKYSLETAKGKIEMYYTIRSAIPEFFRYSDIYSPQLQSVLKLGLMIPIVTVNNNNAPRLILFRCSYDPSKIFINNIVNFGIMLGNVLLWDDDATVVCGVVLIVDLKGISFGQIGQCTLSFMKKLTFAIQKACPIRIKGLHFINAPPICETALKLFLTFLTNKLKNRTYLHDSLEALHTHIDMEALPKEYGGNAGSVQSFAAEMNDKLMQRRDWFIDDEKYRTNESKRPGKTEATDTLFGTNGSFRQLEFD